MAIRSNMQGLIDHIRGLIGDDDSALTDLVIQGYLDANSQIVGQLALTTTLEVNSITKAAEYLRWADPDGQAWEADVVLQDSAYSALTPTTSDTFNGQWAFATSQSMVMATGRRCDINGAAADCLLQLMSKFAREFDVTTKNKGLNRSQAYIALNTQYQLFNGRRMAFAASLGSANVIT